ARLAAEAAKNPGGAQPEGQGATRRVIRGGETPPPATSVAATTPPPTAPSPATTPSPGAAPTQATATSAGAYLGAKASAGGLLPARSLDEAKADPRFREGALVEDAKVKVVSVAEKFPYYGIANNGCTPGRSYVMSELLAPFDGLPAGVPIVLRIEDPTLGPARAGSSLAFSGLRRAGKAPDGTFVYCGRGTAFPVRR
ncbi:MAG: hypothetical protein AB1730_25820, partial [Myxococcota bacterium]